MPTLAVEGLYANSLQNLNPGSVVVTQDGLTGIVIQNRHPGMGNKYLLLRDENGLFIEQERQRDLYFVANGSELELELGKPADPPQKPLDSIGLLGIDASGCFVVADSRPIGHHSAATEISLSMPTNSGNNKDWRWSALGGGRSQNAAMFTGWRLFYFGRGHERVFVF